MSPWSAGKRVKFETMLSTLQHFFLARLRSRSLRSMASAHSPVAIATFLP